uniref:Uncharacterized protein n=1 Tax=Ananas comosus var. bracteatus TaxID=296719 RepID=A0A6V7QM89_ANACO|nr:unnamed protein product [Ananas comosus var. bracteatus]
MNNCSLARLPRLHFPFSPLLLLPLPSHSHPEPNALLPKLNLRIFFTSARSPSSPPVVASPPLSLPHLRSSPHLPSSSPHPPASPPVVASPPLIASPPLSLPYLRSSPHLPSSSPYPSASPPVVASPPLVSASPQLRPHLLSSPHLPSPDLPSGLTSGRCLTFPLVASPPVIASPPRRRLTLRPNLRLSPHLPSSSPHPPTSPLVVASPPLSLPHLQSSPHLPSSSPHPPTSPPLVASPSLVSVGRKFLTSGQTLCYFFLVEFAKPTLPDLASHARSVPAFISDLLVEFFFGGFLHLRSVPALTCNLVVDSVGESSRFGVFFTCDLKICIYKCCGDSPTIESSSGSSPGEDDTIAGIIMSACNLSSEPFEAGASGCARYANNDEANTSHSPSPPVMRPTGASGSGHSSGSKRARSPERSNKQPQTASTSGGRKKKVDARASAMADMVEQGKEKLVWVRQLCQLELNKSANMPSQNQCMQRVYGMTGLSDDHILAVCDAFKEDKNRNAFMSLNNKLVEKWVERQLTQQNVIYRQLFPGL